MKKTIKRIVSLLCMLCLLSSVWLPLLPAAPAERAAAVPASVSDEITVTDGSRYVVTVSYDTDAGIPEGAALSVRELTEEDEGYGEYLARSAEALGAGEESIRFARALDISLYDPATREEYQPTGSVSVSISLPDTSLEESGTVSVVHFGEEAQILPAEVSENAVAFETEGFSVYVVIAHEGETEVESPRIEFHFIAPTNVAPEWDGGIDYFTSTPYRFINKGVDPYNSQTTLIVRNGELIDAVEAPPNILPPGSTDELFFFGWYTVTGEQTGGSIRYSWPDDTQRVEVDEHLTLNAEQDPDTGAVTSMTWTVKDVTGSVQWIDEEGCGHVFLAPIYNNFHFVTLHLGARDDANHTNILARRLIVLGNSQTSTVHIGDVRAPSRDPEHLVFSGWEYDANANNDGAEDWVHIRTINTNDEEVVFNVPSGSPDGYYLTVGSEAIDLYPVFVQARMITFDIGPSGNGALYQGPQTIYTSDVNGDYPVTELKATTSRVGYDFAGWYLEWDDVAGAVVESSRLTDETGKILPRTTELVVNGSFGGTEGVAYRITTDGTLYAYEPLDKLTVYAKWVMKDEAEYKVIIWKQPADPNRTDYDFVDYFTKTANPNVTPTVGPDPEHKNYCTSDPSNYTGFKLGTFDEDVPLDPQGSTVVNVYYDRITYRLRFLFARRAVNGQGDESGNFFVPRLNNTYNPPTEEAYQTMVGYATRGTGMEWDNTNTNVLSNVCSYPSSSIDFEDYNGNRYYYYYFDAVYGAEVGSVWPDYDYFPTINSRYMTSWWMMRSAGFYGSPGQNDTVKGKVAILDKQVLGKPDSPNGNFLIASYRTSSPNNWTYRIYQEVLEGEDYPETVEYGQNPKTYYEAERFTARSSSSNANQQNGPSYTGFEAPTRDPNSGTPNPLVVNFYYPRSSYVLTFMPNYPTTATHVANGVSEPKVYSPVPYKTSLSNYKLTTVPAAPDNYEFDGWYADRSCTVPFNFNGNMPDSNVAVYAKWKLVEYEINIDPAGGIIDHINYDAIYTHDDVEDRDITFRELLAPTGLDGSGFNNYSTYFDNEATQTITKYVDSPSAPFRRPYIIVSDAQAATLKAANEPVYRYVYGFRSGYEGGSQSGKLGADGRNAVYILDTEESIEAYYAYYVKQVELRNASRDDNMDPLNFYVWQSVYLSEEKYAAMPPEQYYELVTWYEIVNGVRERDPFDFDSPATHDTTLRAEWRLVGGYRLQYTTEFYAGDDHITANLVPDQWIDPQDGLSGAYADQAPTHALQEPIAIKVNGVDSNEYQFRGWQIVSVETVSGRPRYTPLEEGKYYLAGQDLMVEQRFADSLGIIHMQAVYEKRTDAYRRPDIVLLTLDADRAADGVGPGTVDSTAGDFPTWGYAGHSFIDTEDDPVHQILFGDSQSNAAVHLYRYATDISPDGVNFFRHPEDYRLLGFDLDAHDTDFIPDFSADAVVAVSPAEAHTLYAVWEPMVYITFTNSTGAGTVSFNLSGTGRSMEIVNRVSGTYTRVPLDPSTTVSLADGASITVAVPYGENQTIFASGTTDLAPGYNLTATSTLGSSGAARTLTGTINGNSSDYTRVPNQQPFGFSEILLVDPVGIVVTFTADQAPHTLVMKDNYDGLGNGGGTKEVQFAEKDDGTVYFMTEDQTGYTLPSTSTRIGYEFIGWDEDPGATTPTFSEAAGWTIADLTAFFGDEAIITLYAIWTVNADSGKVHVWKEVDGPLASDAEFEFTVAFSGGFTYEECTVTTGWWGSTISTWNSKTGTIPTQSRVFTLKHGEHLRITSTKDERNVPDGGTPYLLLSVEKYDSEGELLGSATTIPWQWSEDNNGSNAASSNGNKRAFSFSNLEISVTESDAYSAEYSTEANVIAATSTYTLTPSGRKTSWTSTDAGGTVVYTNTRRTADVTIKKTLLPDSLDPRPFSFTAEFLNGSSATVYEGYELERTSFTIESGTTDQAVIEDIPTGARLRITETTDGEKLLYTTTAAVEGTGSSGIYSDADKSFSFIVNYDATVTFTNETVTQKIRLRVTDDENHPLGSAMFNFPGVFDGTKIASGGLVWEGEVIAGEYTLSEPNMPDPHYRRMQDPVAVTVNAAGVSVPTGRESDVSITKDGDVYVITVINPRLVKISLKKLVDEGDDDKSGSFGFVLSLTQGGLPVQSGNVYGNRGTNASGVLSFTLVHNQTADLYVPKGVQMKLLEENDDYDVTIAASAGLTDADTDSFSYTVASTSVDGAITFTNKLKTSEITVKKVLSEPQGDENEEFSFTVKLERYPTPIVGFRVNSSLGTTDANGEVTFTLKHGDEVTLTIPQKATVTVTETEDARYRVSAASAGGRADLNTTADNIFRYLVEADDTITFTNSPAGMDIWFKKIDGFSQPLSGAKFTLYTNAACTTKYMKNGTEVSATSAGETDTDSLGNTLGKGIVLFEKIPNGVYYMKEADSGVVSGGITWKNSNTYVLLVGSADLVAGTGVLSGITSAQLDAQTGGGNYAIFRYDTTTNKALADPDIKTFGILNESETERRVLLRKNGKKTDSSYEMLKGAHFRIFRPDLSEVTVGQEAGKNYYESLSSGAWFIDSLPYGKYYLVETGAPSDTNYSGNAGNVYVLVVTENGFFDGGDTPVKQLNAKGGKVDLTEADIVAAFKAWRLDSANSGY